MVWAAVLAEATSSAGHASGANTPGSQPDQFHAEVGMGGASPLAPPTSPSRRLRWADSQVAGLICRAVPRREEIEPISSEEPIHGVPLGRPRRAATPVAIGADAGGRRSGAIGRFVRGCRPGERRRTPGREL